MRIHAIAFAAVLACATPAAARGPRCRRRTYLSNPSAVTTYQSGVKGLKR